MAVKPVTVDKNVPQPNKVLDMLGYVFFLISLLTKKNEFDGFHANQALNLWICAIILNVASMIVGWIPVIGWILGLVIWVLDIGIVVLMIIGIMNVNKLECKPLPIIGNMFQFIKY